jgi:hypothetical protein
MGLGSGIRKKPIPDPGSRNQGSKRHRIPDPDPQHCTLGPVRTGQDHGLFAEPDSELGFSWPKLGASFS